MAKKEGDKVKIKKKNNEDVDIEATLERIYPNDKWEKVVEDDTQEVYWVRSILVDEKDKKAK